MCVLVAGPDGRRGAPERTFCHATPARCTWSSSLAWWPVHRTCVFSELRSNVAAQEGGERRRRTAGMPGKLQLADLLGCDRSPSATESGHAVLNRVAQLLLAAACNVSRAATPAFAHPSVTCDNREPPTRLGLFRECRCACELVADPGVVAPSPGDGDHRTFRGPPIAQLHLLARS
jgi:hypothetical protein